MSNEYAMILIDRMLTRRAGGATPSQPIDPALRATVGRLLGELHALRPPR